MSLSETEIIKLIRTLDYNSGERFEFEGSADNELTDSNGDRIVVEGHSIQVRREATGITMVEAEAPIRLYVNDREIEGSAAVTFEDTIVWKAEPPKLFSVDLSEDRMSVSFTVHHLRQRYWKLTAKSIEPNIVRFSAELDPDTIGHPVSESDIRLALHDLKLIRFDSKKIEDELAWPTFEPVEVARGVRPVDGVDASVELLFEEKETSSFEEVNGQVDFRNHLKIPTARSGDVIARKRPCIEGSPGFDVFGQKIEPKKPKDVVLVPKQHVRMASNGDIVALKEGRPRISGGRIKFVSVNPLYVVPNDVDLKTGNIFFSGDVIVYGNVTDGMVIEALGNVYIAGGVFNATVTATGSILVKGNTIGGKLYSGHFGVLYNRLYNHTKKLNDTLQSLRNAGNLLIQTLEAQGKFVPEGQAYQLLVDTKFKDIPATVKEILTSIVTIQTLQRGHLEETKQLLQFLLAPSCFLKVDPGPFLNELQRLLIEASDSIRRCEETDVQLDIAKCQLSTLMSNGDILVRQEGVIQSHLFARNNIVFYQTNAVCKGSTLEAGQTISAMIVGGTHGGACILKAGVKVLISKMFDGRVFIGRFSQEILEPLEQTAFTLKDNRLAVEKL